MVFSRLLGQKTKVTQILIMRDVNRAHAPSDCVADELQDFLMYHRNTKRLQLSAVTKAVELLLRIIQDRILEVARHLMFLRVVLVIIWTFLLKADGFGPSFLGAGASQASLETKAAHAVAY